MFPLTTVQPIIQQLVQVHAIVEKIAGVNAPLDHTFTAATCSPLSGPGNGGVRFDRSPVGNLNYYRFPVGTVGSYYCNSGYIHSGAIISNL